MKHIGKLLLTMGLAAVLCLALGLTACDGGNGIKSVEIDENGHFKFTLDDGTVLDAGGRPTDGQTEEEGTEGLQYQKIKGEDGTVAVVGLGTAWDTDIVIPSTYRGLKVTAIGGRAFSASLDARNANLTSIVIPDSVISIGSSAFYGCSGLTSITIPDSVISIGNGAFSGCSGLTSITIPDSVTSIGASAFYECSGLESVTIGSGVTSIGDAAFEFCSGLTSISIPDSVTTIGEGAFYECSGLESVTIGSGVTSIGDSAFGFCSGLKSVYYMGTADEWNGINIISYNPELTKATRYYYSAEENYDGKHWHYDPVTNQPVVWTREEA